MAERASSGSLKAAAAAAKRRLTFSFDSSGWLYVYHLGAAHYIQTQLMPHLPEDELSFSGSSGGALVACALCTGISIEELARYVIDRYPECRFNPWRMLPSAESAMERFLPEDAALLAEGRLRVLLTRVQFGWMVPLLWPEVVALRIARRARAGAPPRATLTRTEPEPEPEPEPDPDPDPNLALALTPNPNPNPNNSNPNQVLRASCHIPVLGGLLLPRGTRRARRWGAPSAGGEGAGQGARYYDGLFWPSVLWSWRAFNASDTLLGRAASDTLTLTLTLP